MAYSTRVFPVLRGYGSRPRARRAAGLPLRRALSWSIAIRTPPASVELKAYFVERNRLYTVVKNFPIMAVRAFRIMLRYLWHLAAL